MVVLADVAAAISPRSFLTSSGSTGDSKRLPLTAKYVSASFGPFFFAALGNTLRLHPASMHSASATLNLRADPLRRQDGTTAGRPALGASQVDFRTSFGAELMREPGSDAASARIPSELTNELDRIYHRLRLALHEDVRMVVGINPAFVAAIVDLIALWGIRILPKTSRRSMRSSASPMPEPPLPHGGASRWRRSFRTPGDCTHPHGCTTCHRS